MKHSTKLTSLLTATAVLTLFACVAPNSEANPFKRKKSAKKPAPIIYSKLPGRTTNKTSKLEGKGLKKPGGKLFFKQSAKRQFDSLASQNPVQRTKGKGRIGQRNDLRLPKAPALGPNQVRLPAPIAPGVRNQPSVGPKPNLQPPAKKGLLKRFTGLFKRTKRGTAPATANVSQPAPTLAAARPLNRNASAGAQAVVAARPLNRNALGRTKGRGLTGQDNRGQLPKLRSTPIQYEQLPADQRP